MRRRSQETWSEAFISTEDTTVAVSRTAKAGSLSQANPSPLCARTNQITRKNHLPKPMTNC